MRFSIVHSHPCLVPMPSTRRAPRTRLRRVQRPLGRVTATMRGAALCGSGMMCASPSGRVPRSPCHLRVAPSYATLAMALLSFSLSACESRHSHGGCIACASRTAPGAITFTRLLGPVFWHMSIFFRRLAMFFLVGSGQPEMFNIFLQIQNFSAQVEFFSAASPSGVK